MSKNQRPDIDALVRCAERFAALLSREPAPEAEVRRVLEDILFHRESWEAAREHLLTEAELINLVLAHLHTLLIESARVPSASEPGPEPWEDPALRDCIRQSLSLREPNQSGQRS